MVIEQEENNSLHKGSNISGENYNLSDVALSDDLINLLPSTFAILSLEGKFLKWNKKFETVFGYTATEIANIGPLDFFPDDTRAYIAETIKTAFDKGFAEVETEMVTKDGKRLFYYNTANKIKYNGRDCLSAIGIDVSAKRQAQKELELSKFVFAHSFNHSPVGMALLSLDGIWLSMNNVLPEMLGYTKDEMMAGSLQAVTHPDDFLHNVENLKKLKEGKQDIYKAEKRYLHKNGHIVWANINVSLVKDTDGTPMHYIAQIDDISAKKLAEETLREREGQFRLFVEHSPVALAMLDNNMCYLAVSNSWIKDYNLKDVDLIGKSHYDVFPEVPFHWRKIHQHCLQGASEKKEEEVFVRKDGAIEWLRWEIRPWYKASGSIGGIIIFTENITEQKEAELKFRNLVEKSLIGVYIIQDGKLEYANPMYASIFGYTQKELIGRQVMDLVHKDDRKLVEEMIAARENGLKDSVHYEVRCIRKTGGIIHIEAYGSTTLYKGKRAVLGSLMDITERKKSAQALQYSLKELSDYKVALDESSIVAITDQKGVINYVNDNFCKISKYTKEELIGQDHRIINSGYHSKEFIRNIWVTIANGKIWRGDLCNKAKDGTIYWVETTIVPFLNELGKPWQYVAIRSDITNRKLTEQAQQKLTEDLVQRNKDLEQFTYIVSHNLRAPVANIIGYSSELKETKNNPEETLLYINELAESVGRLDTVIKDLNSILQVKHKVSEVKEVVSFSHLLRVVKTGIKNSIDEGGVKINANFEEVREINTLKSYMHSIFQNLITNSIKYRKLNIPPVINITSYRKENSVVLEFSDNGIGIDLHQHGDKIFGLYKRFHPNAAEGKGMGLFMVKTQVEAMGGQISVVSEVNTGTKFIIEFTN